MPLFVARIVAGVVAGSLALAAAVAPSTVFAQDVPSYGRPSTTAQDETIHGRVDSIQGPFAIVLRDDRGFLDSVTLRQGTILNPRGLRLAVGMIVTITGYNAGSSFAALEIDAPYDDAAPPVYSGSDLYDYGLSPIDFGLGIVLPPIVEVIVPVNAAPAPRASGAPRSIEHPTPGEPVLRRPVDVQPSPAASSAPAPAASPDPTAAAPPSYALPWGTAPPPPYVGPAFGVAGGGGGPINRAPGGGSVPGAAAGSARQTPQSRASSPESRAPTPPVRSEPARSAPTAPTRSEPARSEPSRPAPSSSQTRSH
jgi:hypothetical protein